MTIKEAKIFGIKKLRRFDAESAAIDAEILLAHALGITREELLAHDERKVPTSMIKKYLAYLARRAKHEPVAYIIGHKDFFSLPFFVNKNTLIPRPETEQLVEEALGLITHPPLPYLKGGTRLVVIDVGTGSGAIAIAIAKNAPSVTVIATDISKAALKIAGENAALNDVQDQIIFERANLLPTNIARPSINKGIIITANLPYLPTKVWQKCAPDVKKFEPKTALVGGSDGLKYYNELFDQIIERDLHGIIICEIDPSQKRSFPELAKRHFPKAKMEIKNDLAGLARVAIVRL